MDSVATQMKRHAMQSAYQIVMARISEAADKGLEGIRFYEDFGEASRAYVLEKLEDDGFKITTTKFGWAPGLVWISWGVLS